MSRTRRIPANTVGPAPQQPAAADHHCPTGSGTDACSGFSTKGD